ncbi:MAG: ankyrin repeat domain-containing protein [Actinomycetota bacterium]|nr:ankyrin repeat domain-containing protein [Actinomycetota bacterium]
MASSLPDNPSLGKLKRSARRLQRGVRGGHPRALALLHKWHPRPESVAAEDFPLNAAQLTVARRYGFSGWPALVHYLQLANTLGRNLSTLDEDRLAPADSFCALACLRYHESDEPPRWTAAAQLLAARPDLVDDHIWAAAAANDATAVRRQLWSNPKLVNQIGGPFRWTPLMYLTYARVLAAPGVVKGPATEHPVLDTAAALLDAGADPNTGYLFGGLSTPFTALTGAFGEGEQGPGRQPRHPQSIPLARLLLRGGADANDGQTLYNRMFTPDNDHLELLFEFGLGSGDGGPWQRLLGEAMESPAEMLRRQLEWAIDHCFTDRIRLLAEHGVDCVSPSADGVTPRDRAQQLGYFPVVHQLVLAGTVPGLPGGDDVATAGAVLLAGPSQDAPARRWLTDHPDLVAAVSKRWPGLGSSSLVRDQRTTDRLRWAGFDAAEPHQSRVVEPADWLTDSDPPPLAEQDRFALEAAEDGTAISILLGARDEAAASRWLAESPGSTRLAKDFERTPDLIHRAPDAAAIARIAAAGFDVDIKSSGRTALHQAAWAGEVDKVRALLDVGADPSIVDDAYGTTPLGWAEHAYQPETAELLRAVTPQEP